MSEKEYYVVCFDDGFPLLPIDCNDDEYDGEENDEGMLVYRTREGCEAACRHQEKLYGFKNLEARVLGTESVE